MPPQTQINGVWMLTGITGHEVTDAAACVSL